MRTEVGGRDVRGAVLADPNSRIPLSSLNLFSYGHQAAKRPKATAVAALGVAMVGLGFLAAKAFSNRAD